MAQRAEKQLAVTAPAFILTVLPLFWLSSAHLWSATFLFSLSTDDTGRLSKSEIERMVAEAEKFADEDRKVQERSAAKGKLETFAYGLKHAVEDQKVRSRRFAAGTGSHQAPLPMAIGHIDDFSHSSHSANEC